MQCIYVLCIIFIINIIELVSQCNGDTVCLLWSRTDFYIVQMGFRPILVAVRPRNGFAAACLLELWFQILLEA
jgi:hypothetical protein